MTLPCGASRSKALGKAMSVVDKVRRNAEVKMTSGMFWKLGSAWKKSAHCCRPSGVNMAS